MLLCVLPLCACDNSKQEQVSVFSFCGGNERFEIPNGVIVLGKTKEVFDGGDLRVIQNELFSNVALFSVKFYTIRNGEQRVILSNSVVDTTGSSVNIEGDLGRVSGDSIIAYNHVEGIDELKQNLWFELKTADLNGKTQTYQIKLNLTEITDSFTR